MVDMDAAIGYVVAHGDPIERARLSYLRAGNAPPQSVLDTISGEQTEAGGWPAGGDNSVPSVDATCIRLAELDDLGALAGPAAAGGRGEQGGPRIGLGSAGRALLWLAEVQRPDGTWQEADALAPEAPPWAKPGDPEATLYLTAVAGFWLTVAARHAVTVAARHTTTAATAEPPAAPGESLTATAGRPDPRTASGESLTVTASKPDPRVAPGEWLTVATGKAESLTATTELFAASAGPLSAIGGEAGPAGGEVGPFSVAAGRAARFVAGQLRPDGSWPSFLAAGRHAAGLLHGARFFDESARVQLVLGDRLDGMSPTDVANMAAALRRVDLGDDLLLRSARKRLSGTQRTDGGWDSDEGPVFDVNTTLTAIRACR